MSEICVAESVDASANASERGWSVWVGFRALEAALKVLAASGGERVLLRAFEDECVLSAVGEAAAAAVSMEAVGTHKDVAVVFDHGAVVKLVGAGVKGVSARQRDGVRIVIRYDGQAYQLDVGGFAVPLVAAGEVEEFPALPDAMAPTHVVGRSEFVKRLAQVNVCASTDQLLPVLCGVSLDMGVSTVELTATDRFRLAGGTVQAHGTCEEQFLVPAEVNKLAKLLPEGEEITLGVTEHNGRRWLSIASDNMTAWLKELDGSFPRVSRLFDVANPNATLELDRVELQRAATRAAALTKITHSAAGPIELVAESTALQLAPVCADGGTTKGPAITAVVHGDPAGMTDQPQWVGRVSGALFTEMVGVFTTDKISVTVSAPNKPIMLRSHDGSLRHVVMPMRIA